LAMDEDDAPRNRASIFHPAGKPRSIGMTGGNIEGTNTSVDLDFLTLNSDRPHTALQDTSKRALRLITDHENRGIGAPQMVLKVVADTAGVAHAACRRDAVAAIEAFDHHALLNRLRGKQKGGAHGVTK